MEYKTSLEEYSAQFEGYCNDLLAAQTTKDCIARFEMLMQGQAQYDANFNVMAYGALVNRTLLLVAKELRETYDKKSDQSRTDDVLDVSFEKGNPATKEIVFRAPKGWLEPSKILPEAGISNALMINEVESFVGSDFQHHIEALQMLLDAASSAIADDELAQYCRRFMGLLLRVSVFEEGAAPALAYDRFEKGRMRTFKIDVPQTKDVRCYQAVESFVEAEHRLTARYQLDLPYLYLLTWTIALPELSSSLETESESYHLKELQALLLSQLERLSAPAVTLLEEAVLKQKKSFFFALFPIPSELITHAKNPVHVFTDLYTHIPMMPLSVKPTGVERLQRILELSAALNRAEKNEKMYEVALRDKEALMAKHAHNWKHISYPETVWNVAEKLWGKGEHTLANDLYKAYHSEVLLRQDLMLLPFYYASDNDTYLRKFRSSVARSGRKDAIGLEMVFEEALSMVLFPLLKSKKEFLTEQAQDSLFSPEHHRALCQSYDVWIMQHDKESGALLAWVAKEFYPISFEIKGDALQDKIFFLQGEIAHVQMKQIFIELITNAINYGVKTKEGALVVQVQEVREQDEPYCLFVVKNKLAPDSALLQGSGSGLKDIEETVAKLNEMSPRHFSALEKDGWFEVSFKLKRSLIVRKGLIL